jgi:hypothetical protein
MMDFISMLGYSDKSPYKHNPYLDIHTPDGTISMADTSIDLIGIDNLGNVKKMKGGRKNPYKFEGNIVREIPVKSGNPYQEGGITPEQVFGFLFDGDDERKQQKEELRLLQERELAVEENEMRQAAQLREIGRQRKMMEEEAQYNLAMGLAMEDGNLDLNSPRFTNTTPIVQSSKPFVATNTDLYGTAKQYEGTPYKFAGTSKDGIDCSGYVCRVVGLPRTSSEEIVKNAPNFRQFTGNPYDFKEGTVIGFDTGIASFEKKEGNKRKYGMDHVGVIVRKPETGELLYTHSAGSTGVKTMTIPEMLRKYKNSRIFLGDYGQKTK